MAICESNKLFNTKWKIPEYVPDISNFVHNRSFGSAFETVKVSSESFCVKVTFGDAFRDPRVFGHVGVKEGYGRKFSNHKIKLAIDLNLFKDGVYLTKTSDHEFAGLFWEEMGGEWGGRFEDGNHYSLEHNGRR